MSLSPTAELSSSNEPSGASLFEQTITNNRPILESLLAQLPTESILDLYHTSRYLQQFLRSSPSSWRFVSWRQHQPAIAMRPGASPSASPTRQSSSYPLDRLLMFVVLPMSTCLTSLVLDNTTVSGANLVGCVMVRRKETLRHLSVRGCKNVSLKYHINPWLTMHAMALDQPPEFRPPEYSTMVLKSLYAYRCRHHRRRPYLPSSLTRKESDSEPTHDLVLICHKLGIWTDTAWCTTPGSRCFRRRGYVAMRSVQDTREVWVVFDRLWRSRNWLGATFCKKKDAIPSCKRKWDGRLWEEVEEAYNGEPLGTRHEGKSVPVHERFSHTQFVTDIHCNNCQDLILERCEQCSVLMHCSGCRKTLCASCAFDRPYLRNKNASQEERHKFWWAPGSAVSPCSMQDIDPAAPGAPNLPTNLPNLSMKWCCAEPVFSGGGGITVGATLMREADRIRAVPLQPASGFDDPEFVPADDEDYDLNYPAPRTGAPGPGGRWNSIKDLFKYAGPMTGYDPLDTIPRILCDDCYSSEKWKVKCKACAVALCLKHDVKEKQRVRVCGYKELPLERQEMLDKIKAGKLLKMAFRRRKWLRERDEAERAKLKEGVENLKLSDGIDSPLDDVPLTSTAVHTPAKSTTSADSVTPLTTPMRTFHSTPATENLDLPDRPVSPGSNISVPLSRSSSPAPSARSAMTTPEPLGKKVYIASTPVPTADWRGCQSFFCSRDRSVGDHRRRCTAIIRPCFDCKVFACEDCLSGFDASCQCKGCRLPDGQVDEVTNSTAAFFCPNCRHNRIITRRCKRNLAYLNRRDHSVLAHELASSKRSARARMTAVEKAAHNPDFLSSPATLLSMTSTIDADFTLADFYSALDHELAEYEEIGQSAVQVVRKVQNLRLNAPPGSAAARALPNIIIEGVDFEPTNTTQAQTAADASGDS